MSTHVPKRRGGSIRMAAGALFLFSVLAGGCGGQSEKTTGERETRDREPLCRKFAARYTAGNVESTCSFDRDTLSLTCEPTTRFEREVTTWATIDDALNDNHPIGRITVSRRSFVLSEVTFTDTFSYDAAGRPTSSRPTIVETPPDESAGHGTDAFDFTAWDAEKRPTRALISLVYEGPPLAPPGGCSGQEQTFEYDDANRKYVETRAPGGGPFCLEIVRTWTFDADGILLEEARTFEEPGVIVIPYTTLETGEICRD